jgi:hypothetical protein
MRANLLLMPSLALVAACSSPKAESPPPPPAEKPVAAPPVKAEPTPPPVEKPAELRVPGAYADLFVKGAAWKYKQVTVEGTVDDEETVTAKITCTVVDVTLAPERAVAKVTCDAEYMPHIAGTWVADAKGLWYGRADLDVAKVAEDALLVLPAPLANGTSENTNENGVKAVVTIESTKDGWCRRESSGGEDDLIVRKSRRCVLAGAATPVTIVDELVDNGRMLSTKVTLSAAK